MMRHPLVSILVAFGLFLLGGMVAAPYSPAKLKMGPDGIRVQRSEKERREAEFRVNWPAYACFAGSGLSLIWTLYLVSAGLLSIFNRNSDDPTG